MGDPRRYIGNGPRKVPVKPAAAGIIVAALVIGLIAAVVCSSASASNESSEIDAVVESFLQATSNRDFTTANTYLSRRYENVTVAARSPTDFTNDPAYSDVASLKRIDLDKMPRIDLDRAPSNYEYRGRISYSDGSTAEVTATVVFEDRAWKIDEIEVER